MSDGDGLGRRAAVWGYATGYLFVCLLAACGLEGLGVARFASFTHSPRSCTHIAPDRPQPIVSAVGGHGVTV